MTCDEAILRWVSFMLKEAQRRGKTLRIREHQLERSDKGSYCPRWCEKHLGVRYNPASYSRRWREIREQDRHRREFAHLGVGRIHPDRNAESNEAAWIIYPAPNLEPA